MICFFNKKAQGNALGFFGAEVVSDTTDSTSNSIKQNWLLQKTN